MKSFLIVFACLSILTSNSHAQSSFNYDSNGNLTNVTSAVAGPPTITAAPTYQFVNNGSGAVFGVLASGSQPLSYQWLDNGVIIQGATNSSLFLPNAIISNQNSYSVKVCNAIDCVTVAATLAATIPNITAQPTNQTVLQGGSASFFVSAVGTSPLSYQWLFNGTNIPGATSSNLVLTNISICQAGQYAMIVSNLYGSTPSFDVNLWVGKAAPGVEFSSLYAFGTIEEPEIYGGISLDGSNPYAGLMMGIDGYLYGTATEGGSSPGDSEDGFGTIFRTTTNGVLTTLYSFGAILDTNGNPVDGAYPYSYLVQSIDGNLYGTTAGEYGGEDETNGFGTVFRITTNGTLTTLYSFGTIQDANGNPLDGAYPYFGLVFGQDGNLYGTTSGGGTNTNGYGTVFRITTNGVLTTLYSFGKTRHEIQDADGAYPYGGLVFGQDGNLYGTTSSGGTNTNGFGTVFRITTNGVLTTLYSFGTILDTNGNPLDGAYPFDGLVFGADGNLYGTTAGNNGNNVTNCFGTVFRMTTNGVLTTLYSFGAILETNGSPMDGVSPYAGLIQGSDGNFYGTTTYGGINNNGTLFKITTNGMLTTLYWFSGGNDGANPYDSPIQASDGSFYGTASNGGTNDNGNVFRFSVSAVSAPFLIQSIVRSNSIVTLTWNTVADQTYQVQCATNLSQTSWIDFGLPILATNTAMSISDTVGNSQRFYRIMLVQ